MGDLAQRMDPGIGTARGGKIGAARRQRRTRPLRSPAGSRGRSPGAASRHSRVPSYSISRRNRVIGRTCRPEAKAAQEGWPSSAALPGRWTRSRRSAPSPQAIVSRSSSSVPGAALPWAVSAASTLMRSPAISHQARRHRAERPHLALQIAGWPAPIQPFFLAGELGRIGDALGRLRLAVNCRSPLAPAPSRSAARRGQRGGHAGCRRCHRDRSACAHSAGSRRYRGPDPSA